MAASEFNPVLDSHEDRLQRVESKVQDLVEKTAEIGTKQDYLARAVEDQGQALLARLDSGFEKVQLGHDADIREQQSLADRLIPVENHHRASKRRNDFLKKATIPLLAAAAGVFGSRLSEIIWSWMTK